MKTFKNSRRAGISLVALVITIIVLIILTGAVIVTFMEGGIVDRAKESVFKNDMRTYQEILALKRAENQMKIALGEMEPETINARNLDDIREIIPEFKEEYEGLVVITNGELSIGERVRGEDLSSSEELYSTWLGDIGIGLSRIPKDGLANYVKVGDYIEYEYTEGTYTTPTGSKGVNSTTQSFNSNSTNKIEKWRVLSTDYGEIKIIADDELPSLTLYGENGYLNGETVLNEMCKTLYSGKYGEARSINLQDIYNVTETTGKVNYYYENVKAEPYIGIQNMMFIGKELITIGQLEAQEKNGDLAGLKELKSDVILGANSLSDLKINAVGFQPYEFGITNWREDIAWEMLGQISGSELANYWVAYKCLHPEYYLESDTSNNSLVTYRMLHYREGLLGSRSLWSSSNEKNATYGARTGISVRPVVLLNSGLEIKSGEGTSTSPWIIK